MGRKESQEGLKIAILVRIYAVFQTVDQCGRIAIHIRERFAKVQKQFLFSGEKNTEAKVQKR